MSPVNALNHPARPAMLAGLELLASAVVMLDADGHIAYANAAAENLLASSLKAMSRQKLSAQFINPDELDHICAQAREHKFSDLRQDLTLERAGRDPLHVHSIVSALDEPPGHILIELREHLQHLKLDREERILDQSQVNKELIRNLAHEIKNPLGGIRGAAQLLELVGLRDLADSPAKVLSRGQKQKLGLARALVHDPQVLLLDEPASGLDPEARIQLRTLLRSFAAEGRTVLISSHILSELEEVVDDAVFLVAGSVVDAAPGQSTGRAWRVRLLGADAARQNADSWQVAQTLGLPIESLGADRGGVLVGFDSEEAAALGLRSLVQAGLQISEFAPAQSALEHTFLTLNDPAAAAARSAAQAPPTAPPSPPAATDNGEAGA